MLQNKSRVLRRFLRLYPNQIRLGYLPALFRTASKPSQTNGTAKYAICTWVLFLPSRLLRNEDAIFSYAHTFRLIYVKVYLSQAGPPQPTGQEQCTFNERTRSLHDIASDDAQRWTNGRKTGEPAANCLPWFKA